MRDESVSPGGRSGAVERRPGPVRTWLLVGLLCPALLAACAESGGSSVGGGAGSSGAGGVGGTGGSGGSAGVGGTGGSGGSAGVGGTGGSGGSAGTGGWLPRHNESSPLGTNLTGLSDWSGEWAFVDAFKSSRPWISGDSSQWDDGRALDLDEHGWVRSLQPGQLARTLLFWVEDGRYPAGRYVVLHEGQGTIEYWGSATRNDELSAPGRDVIDVDPSLGGLGINLTAVEPTDPLRQLRVLMPGGSCAGDPYRWCETDSGCAGRCQPFEETYRTQLFHPTFLDRLKTYRLLRFMDWMATNDSDLAEWADRPRPDDARWRAHGVPVEVMVELANQLGADPWFCLPHLATDDFATQLATYVHDHLRPDVKAHVEYSNEVWNSMFGQARHASEAGLAAGLGASPYEAQLFFYSRRAVQLFARWEQVYGGTGGFVRVMAAQAANPWTAEQVLSFEDASRSVDALAIAPYFGWSASPADAAELQQLTPDALFSKVSDEILPEAIGWMHDNKVVADGHGVPLVAYEGGQHFVGIQGAENDDSLNAKFDDLNRDPRMGQLYTTYLEGWRAAGGQDFAHFVNCGAWSKWGRWGALEWVSQPRAESPKYDALQLFIEENPRWW